MTIGDEITLIDTLLNERGDPADLHERSPYLARQGFRGEIVITTMAAKPNGANNILRWARPGAGRGNTSCPSSRSRHASAR
jgi:hypothetical protein